MCLVCKKEWKELSLGVWFLICTHGGSLWKRKRKWNVQKDHEKKWNEKKKKIYMVLNKEREKKRGKKIGALWALLYEYEWIWYYWIICVPLVFKMYILCLISFLDILDHLTCSPVTTLIRTSWFVWLCNLRYGE